MSLLIANWKSHKTVSTATAWVEAFGDLREITSATAEKIVVCPSYPLLAAVRSQLEHYDLPFTLGAQDCSQFPFGQYTGDVAAELLQTEGVTHVIVGHSERRRHAGETPAVVAAKASQAHLHSLLPIICIDEPEIDAQLAALEPAVAAAAIWAYEPLSAIGTGERVSLDLVKRVRSTLETKVGSTLTFVYGGSVTDASVGEYLLVTDGVLVGGASLEANSFRDLVLAARAQPRSNE